MSTGCFLPNGTKQENPGHIPCNRTAVDNGEHSACCFVNDLCLTNGMCRNQANDAAGYNFYWRNGCTDLTWEDPACPHYCLDDDDDKAANHLIFNCLDSSNTKWACKPTDVDVTAIVMTEGCGDPSYAFTAVAPLIYTTAEFPSIPRISTTATATSFSSVSQASIASSDGINPTATTTNAPSSSSSTSSNPSSGPSTGTKVGLGVGISLGVVFLAIIGVVIVLLRRRRTAQPREMDGQGWTGYGKPGAFTLGQPHNAPIHEVDSQPKPAELAGSVR